MSTGFNLTLAHIEQALAKIDRDGIPPRRNSKVYDLLIDNKKYPLKCSREIDLKSGAVSAE